MYQEGTPLATQQPGVPRDLCPKRCSISRPLRLLFPLLKMLLPPDLFNIQCLSGHDLNLNATFLEKPFQTHPIKLPSYPPAILYLIPCFIFFIDFSQPETSLFVCLFVCFYWPSLPTQSTVQVLGEQMHHLLFSAVHSVPITGSAVAHSSAQ